MGFIVDILEINEVVLFFAYGQVFFTLGLSVALQSRKHSRLALARHLRWLAAFGITHSIYEWGHAFIPVQAAFLPADAIGFLEFVRTALLVTSFYLLLQFGMLVVWPYSNYRWVTAALPAAILLTWVAVSIGTGAIVLAQTGLVLRLPASSDLARITLGFAGAATASLGMLRQAKLVAGISSPRIVWYFRFAAFCLASYAVVAGLIASRGEWTVAMFSNSPFFGGFSPIFPPMLRSIVGLGMAFAVIRGLEIFQIETDRFMEERNELRLKEEVRSHLLARVIVAQEDERKRVARELHDETGQSLSAVIMGLGAAAETLTRDTVKAAEIVEDVREIAVRTLEGVRQIIVGLRPALLDDLGLAPALRRMAADYSRRSSVQVEVYSNELDGRLPPEVETVLFRILQEGMNNVARHSGAKRATLRLVRGKSEIRAMLEDDGIGFNPAEAMAHLETGCGLGLIGMRERASSVGGNVAIVSALGRGTKLDVRLPLVEREYSSG